MIYLLGRSGGSVISVLAVQRHPEKYRAYIGSTCGGRCTPDMQPVDLRRDVPRLAVPVYFVQGGHEMRSLAEPFRDWYQRLDAPQKHRYVFETAGHRAMFEQPDCFAAVMDRVLMG